jgi:hypothetical protein
MRAGDPRLEEAVELVVTYLAELGRHDLAQAVAAATDPDDPEDSRAAAREAIKIFTRRRTRAARRTR